MAVMHDGGGMLVCIVMHYKIDVTPNMALDKCESLHVTIPYLLRIE